MSSELIAQIEGLVRRDPARRGLISSEAEFGPLCPGHLRAAATHLAGHARSVAIITGFFIPKGNPPAAETDGPPGALFLGKALLDAGIPTTIITDSPCVAACRAAADAMEFPRTEVWECPLGESSWCEQFWQTSLGHNLTHLIALERVGPSHSWDSLCRQKRAAEIPEAAFRQSVPETTWNHCHNMRGEIIDTHTAPLHRMFEYARMHRPEIKTIGIGDGGNELGMGLIPWEELVRRLANESSARIPCRIATDWNIIAGTSNWGGQALATAVLLLRGRTDILRDLTFEQQEQALQLIVQQGPAVDGVTREQEATVDGLPFLTYIQPWLGMRHLLGWNN
ncbi:MAG: hypothetical protein JWM11_6056 [Planctomycetaceae bacterium]|nr:hypothetical protein [Planctomycetaceae bacterium]